MKKYEKLKVDLKNCTDCVLNAKTTCSLYKLKTNIDECLSENKINNRQDIIESLNKLNNLVPSKYDYLFQSNLRIFALFFYLYLNHNI